MPPANAIEFRSNFDDCPVGPFTTAHKQLAFPGQSIDDNDPDGTFYSIVAGGRYTNNYASYNCCRMHYPPGGFGQSSVGYYRIKIPSPQDMVNVEFDWFWEDGFDFVAGGHGADGGKIAPRLVWGSFTSGTSLRVEFNPIVDGKLPKWTCFRSHLTDGSGTRYHSPEVYHTGRWYHFHLWLFGGPQGSAGIQIDGVPVIAAGPTSWGESINDSVTIDFGTFFGGGGEASAPTIDSYARMDRIHVWTGTGPGTPLDYD